jgi:very-short-patch-repair endonuclease
MTKRLTPIVRRLRRNKTEAEGRLWSRLRNRQLEGAKFRFQTQVGDFMPDFICSDAMLIIELDGGQHGEQIERDATRTLALQAAGSTVIRFWNNDVLANTNGVLEEIRLALINTMGAEKYGAPT